VKKINLSASIRVWIGSPKKLGVKRKIPDGFFCWRKACTGGGNFYPITPQKAEWTNLLSRKKTWGGTSGKDRSELSKKKKKAGFGNPKESGRELSSSPGEKGRGPPRRAAGGLTKK